MVLLEMSLVPMDAGESVSEPVAECVRLIDQSGLPYELHSMGTIVEGDLPEVMALMQRCLEHLAVTSKRVSCSAKIDYRPGHRGRLRSKVASVQEKLQASSTSQAP